MIEFSTGREVYDTFETAHILHALQKDENTPHEDSMIIDEIISGEDQALWAAMQDIMLYYEKQHEREYYFEPLRECFRAREENQHMHTTDFFIYETIMMCTLYLQLPESETGKRDFLLNAIAEKTGYYPTSERRAAERLAV